MGRTTAGAAEPAAAERADWHAAPLEAGRRLVRHGPNALPGARARTVWGTLLAQLRSPMVGLGRGEALAPMLQTGLALAVAAVPEGLPTVALAAVLHTVPLGPTEWLVVLASAAVPVALLRLRDAFTARSRPATDRETPVGHACRTGTSR
jgi:hypothetical protein